MATIYDVARVAGVSIKTVSRVINGSHVKETTRSKVLAAMAQLDYEPSIYARGMAGQRNWVIGVYRCSRGFFADDLTFLLRTLAGFERHLTGAGYRLLLDSARWRKQKSCLASLARQVDGILMLDAPSPEERAEMHKLIDKVPLVTIGHRRIGDKATYAVGVDNRASVAMAISHLHKLGHVRIGLIVEGEATEHYQDRVIGYKQGMAQLGLPAEWLYIIPYRPDQAHTLAQWLRQATRPSAVVVSEERTAANLLHAARACGVGIPSELAVVTFEDSYFSNLLDPPLTVLRRDDAQIGKEAAAMLLKLIANESVAERELLIPAELVIRQSCGAESEKNTSEITTPENAVGVAVS